MIAHNTLQLSEANGTPLLLLAPYGEEQLQAVLPIDTDGLAFSDRQREYIAVSTAAVTIENEQKNSHRITWGIYNPDGLDSGTFLGTVNLNEHNTGTVKNPNFVRTLQEIGTFIMNKSARGKGFGTLAKLAVIDHHLETPETKAFIALTSAQNEPAQCSLYKLGFGKVKDYDNPRSAPFAEQQMWQFIREEGIGLIAKGNQEHHAALMTLWQRYANLRGEKNVIEIP